MQCMWLLAFAILLVILSIFDILTMKIPMAGLVSTYIISVLYICLSGERETGLIDMIVSCMPGIILGVTSYLTEGKIGPGDAILITGLGAGLGLERISYVLCAALILVCLFSIVMLVLKKYTRTSRIPFVPFITAGLGVMGYVFR